MHKTSYCNSLLLGLSLLLATLSVNADQYTQGYDSAYQGDYGTAYSMWLPLAMKGDARAQFNLGLMYHSGLFVDQDESRALYWYHKAAANGIREAQEYLVMGYSEGWFGLRRDEQQARYWQEMLASSSN